jgi:hypothetical protein
MSSVTRGLLLAASMLTLPPTAAAQMLPGSEVGASAEFAVILLEGVSGVLPGPVRGLGYGVYGRLAASRVEIDVAYHEVGGLRMEVEGPGVDYVAAEALAGFRFHPAVKVEGGISAYGIIDPSRNRRLVSWRTGAAVDLPLVREVVSAQGQFFVTVTGRNNAGASVHGGGGGSVGIRVDLPNLPGWASISYHAATAELNGGAGSEHVRRIAVAVGWQMQ